MDDWRTEIKFRQFLRDHGGLSPYRDTVRWRRRFWWLLAAALAGELLTILLLTR
jgi:hypothetical protein